MFQQNNFSQQKDQASAFYQNVKSWFLEQKHCLQQQDFFLQQLTFELEQYKAQYGIFPFIYLIVESLETQSDELSKLYCIGEQLPPPCEDQQIKNASQNSTQIALLQSRITTQDSSIKYKESEICSLQSTIDQLQTLMQQQTKQIKKLKAENSEKQYNISELQGQAEIQETQCQNLNKLIQQQLILIQTKEKDILNLTKIIEQIEVDYQKQIDFLRSQLKNQIQRSQQVQNDSIQILSAENKKLKGEIQSLNQQNQQQAIRIQSMHSQDEINILQLKIDQEYKKFTDAKNEIVTIKNQFEIKSNQKDQEIQTFKKLMQKTQNQVVNLQNQLANKQQINEQLEAELKELYQLKQYVISNGSRQDQFIKEQEERLKKLQQEKQKDKPGKNIKPLQLLGNVLRQATKQFGTLDICFIVDSTKSMEPYIKQTRDCIKQSSELIKKLTNRDINWSTICYTDIEQKPANGLYLQHDFTKNLGDIETLLDGIKTAGGSDPPEDVKGALLQMLSNLKWTARFKIALLITDASCHGKKYHNCPRENHPNDDIEEAIIKLIDQNIIFIGLNFKKDTTQMYQEIKKIYEAKQKQDIFSYVDMTNVKMEQIATQMAKCIGDASQNATGTNNNSTKSKRIQQARLQAKDGAMEALCKQGNFYNFEKQADVKCVQTKFKVLKIEITQEAFENNLTEIHNIGTLQSDYRVTEEGEWNCIRTDQPFAFGMMKDVFLMKKNGAPDELYVIKTPLGSEPYNTQEAAISECRSHLLCQQLMNKFQRDIEEAIQSKKLFKQQYPKVVYSSFLILKESETKYWIAERFFKGEFVKYNNNFGFMNDNEDQLNKFAQAFSLYTLYISGTKYIVNDVQGVGIYFTDPAINTLEGNFDETDMGEDGIGMFLVNYQSKRGLTKEIEDLLDINI